MRITRLALGAGLTVALGGAAFVATGQTPSDRAVRIVAVTGWGQDLDRQQSREAGFDVHLVKPVDMEQLENVLAERNGARIH